MAINLTTMATSLITNSTPLTNSTASSTDIVTRTTFLAIITFLAFISNLFLIVTLMSSSFLRSLPFHCHILNLSCVNLVTCVFEMPIIIGYSVTGSWEYGELFCRIFAHIILSSSVATCLSILIMNMDRVIAIANPGKYSQKIKPATTFLIMLLSWITSILFPLPLSLQYEPVASYTSRYSCNIASGASINYLVSFYALCFAIPCVVNVLFFVYIARETLSERASRANMPPSANNSLLSEVQAAGIVLVLFLTWILTELPYIALTSIQQYTSSKEVNGVFSYPAGVDTGLMWLKLCDPFLSVCVIVKLRKEIWLKLKNILLCRKSNSVNDSSPRQEKQSNKVTPKLSENSKNTVFNPKSAPLFKIPTLKATREGLHVQTDGENDDEEGVFYADMNLTNQSSVLNLVTTKAIIEQQGESLETKDDTSDYETDPFSQSDPISIRLKNLEPELQQHQNVPSNLLPRRTKAHSISLDSGNGSAQSSVTKKKRKRKKKKQDDDDPNEGRITNDDNGGHQENKPLEYIQSNTNMQKQSYVDKREDNSEQRADSKLVKSSNKIDPSDHTTSVELIEIPTIHDKKKKKKKKNKYNFESQSAVIQNVESGDRPVPPPRLAPLSKSPAITTPPLRSKFPQDVEDLSQPFQYENPAGRTRRKRKDTKLEVVEETQNSSENLQADPQNVTTKKRSRGKHKEANYSTKTSNSKTESLENMQESAIQESYM